MKNSNVKEVFRALIIGFLISLPIMFLAAIRASNVGATNGEIIDSMYVYSGILGIATFGIGFFLQKKYKLTAKILKILGTINIIITVLVFIIVHVSHG